VELDKAALKGQLEELTKEQEVVAGRAQDAAARITQLEEAVSTEQAQVSLLISLTLNTAERVRMRNGYQQVQRQGANEKVTAS
jgi:hypothetical protein